MYTFLIFLVLCAVEYGFYLFKKNELEEHIELIKHGARAIKREKEIDSVLMFVAKVFNTFKYAFVFILLIANLFIALILGILISVISHL